MKVLLINHFPLRGSGSGIFVRNIARNLTKRGHEVCIIMPENTIQINPIDNVKIHPVFFKREEIIENSLDFNFPCMDLHPRSNMLFENMTENQMEQYCDAFRKAIEEEIKEFNPDVIHAQHIWIVSGLLKDYSVPYIITSHGAEFITYRKTEKFDNYGISAIEGCKKVIAISTENKEEIIAKFPNAKNKLKFMRNGYNAKDFYIDKSLNKKDILEKYSIDGDFEKIVLFVGRVSELKGLDVLFKAAKIYETEKILTLIVGDGDYKNELNELKEKLKLKNIVFIGSKEHDELREIYNIADVFVLPSRKEAMPLVAIEALACGTPAIITNLLGMDEIITKEVGFVFEKDNEKMLAEKIQLILNKEVVFDKNFVSEYANKNYTEEILIDKLLAIYEQIKNKGE